MACKGSWYPALFDWPVMKLLTLRPACMLALVFLLALPALAQAQDTTTPKLQTSYKEWKVFTHELDGDRVCYVQSEPTDMNPKNVDHGKVAFFVGTWHSGRAFEQPSLMTGYSLRAKTPPRAIVGSTRITMFAVGREAFVESSRDEKKLVKAMRDGSTLRVEAMSDRGTATSYEFSLSGITAALKKADQLCK